MTPVLDFRAIVLSLLVGKYGEANLEKAYKMRRRITVVLGIARDPNGLTRRKWIGRRYKVTINRGWTDFAYDAARLMVSRNQTLDPLTEKILLEPAVSIEQLSTQLKNITLEYVRKDAWYSSAIDLHEERRPHSTTFRLPDKLYELICYFIVAHELGHIFAEHFDGRCPKTSDERWAAELEADRIGINLLLACLGTPLWLPKTPSELKMQWFRAFVRSWWYHDELSFCCPFRFGHLQFSIPCRPAGGDPRASSSTRGFPEECTAAFAPPALRPAFVGLAVTMVARLAPESTHRSPRYSDRLAS
jgi:hypothetical protein